MTSETKATVTAGQWGYRRASRPSDGEFDFGISGVIGGKHYCIAETFGRVAFDIRPNAEANAKLIVTAVNACFALCPSDPLRAAEAIPRMHEFVGLCAEDRFDSYAELRDAARALLATLQPPTDRGEE